MHTMKALKRNMEAAAVLIAQEEVAIFICKRDGEDTAMRQVLLGILRDQLQECELFYRQYDWPSD